MKFYNLINIDNRTLGNMVPVNIRQYQYIGDRNTDPCFKNKVCKAVLRKDGKCIRGKNGNMLVVFSKTRVVVQARLLRKKG